MAQIVVGIYGGAGLFMLLGCDCLEDQKKRSALGVILTANAANPKFVRGVTSVVPVMLT